MSKIWTNNSIIEKKESTFANPALSDFKTRISINSIYDIVKKYQNNNRISENDYLNIIYFINNHPNDLSELILYIKTLFGEELKIRYFKFIFEQNKNKIDNYTYTTIYNFLINNIEDSNIDSIKNTLYQTIQKIPELFNSDMVPNEFKEKIDTLLSSKDIDERDKKTANFDSESIRIGIFYMKKN